MSLRARVALATAAGVALVVSCLGVALVALFADAQWDALDQRLDERTAFITGVAEAADAVELGDVARGTAEDIGDDAALAADVSARLTLPDGTTQVLGAFPSSIPDQADGTRTVEADGVSWRVATTTATGPGRFATITISVAEPTAATAAAIDRVRILTARLGLLAAVVAAVAGWLLARAAMGPLDRLRRDTAGLAEEPDLAARVPVGPGPEEVTALVRTLNQLLDRLQEADTRRRTALESARSFAGDAAHELRNPLAAMRADLELLRTADLDPVEWAEVVDELHDQQQRVERTLAALRVLALTDLRGIPERAEVDLGELASEVAADLGHEGGRIAIVHRGSCVVQGWAEGLRLALANVVENAARHGRPPEGTAHVEVIVVGTTSTVSVTVVDHGPGIPAHDRDRLVRRFERGDVHQPGTGLGLAIAAEQLSLHGGHLTLGEGRHGGAVVTLDVPRTAPSPR